MRSASSFDVLEVLGHLLRVLRQARVLGDVARRADREATERADALGDRVVLRREVRRERVEQRVQRSELRALDVPVRDLDLRVQVEAIGEHAAQRVTELACGLRRESGWGSSSWFSLRVSWSSSCRHRQGHCQCRRGGVTPRRCAPRRSRGRSEPTVGDDSLVGLHAGSAAVHGADRQREQFEVDLVSGRRARRCMRSRGGSCSYSGLPTMWRNR
jgi:hypothetical protein